jgi:DNA-binding CsgD family transcriptional regulator
MKPVYAIPDGNQARTLAFLISLLTLTVMFFVGDVVMDLRDEGPSAHNVIEAAFSLALIAGVIVGARQIHRLLARTRKDQAALLVARGALAELIEARLKDWRLTPAEAEVALLALKGFDAAAIAEFRGAAAGTVRAQLARVYAKAGVSSHVELMSIFVDDLLGTPIRALKQSADTSDRPDAEAGPSPVPIGHALARQR